MSAPSAPAHPPTLIARQLAWSFGIIAGIAAVMCAMLLGIIYEVSTLVSGMRQQEASIRQGLELATAVREQYIHAAHSLIEGDRSHLEHYEPWRSRIREGIEKLAAAVPGEERWRLHELSVKTQRMHERFATAALPAALRGQLEETRVEHRELEALAEEAAAHADALARAVESNMVHSHVLATNSTRWGLVGGGVCLLLVLGLSIGFTWRLRSAVLRPLLVLTDAARRYGQGDFSAAVGPVGTGEFAALGHAFDAMARELSTRQARLVQSERMAAIGQLAAGVAHELSNPIGIIRGYLKTMTSEMAPQTLADELAILDEEAQHCQRIAEDLLAYARSTDLLLERVEIAAFLQRTVERFGESPSGRGALVGVDAAGAQLDVDRSRFRQVVLNLLTNACQAAGAEKPIRVRGSVERDCYRLEIIDQGPGIEVGERERVFEPFFSKRAGGTGLGLSVCLGIVKAHHGSIEVLEAASEGTVFCVRLPLPSSAMNPRGPEQPG